MPLECPHCSTAIDASPASMCPACEKSLVLLGRYRIDAFLGRGGMGSVYAATDGEAEVAVKVMRLANAKEWKGAELFERSTRVLQSLSHASLPKVHAFEKTEDGDLVLVRERFDGDTLEERAKKDLRLSPERFRALLTSLLEAFVYLHTRVPPVLHRDVKPSNVMFRAAEDDLPVLVDFDTVANVKGKGSNSTIIASPGYTAPEQFAGISSPAGDLYGVGATMLFVATHVSPDDLPRDDDGRFVFGDALASLDDRTRRVLTKLVEPERANRYASASAALADLRALEPTTPKEIAIPSAARPRVRAPHPERHDAPEPPRAPSARVWSSNTRRTLDDLRAATREDVAGLKALRVRRGNYRLPVLVGVVGLPTSIVFGATISGLSVGWALLPVMLVVLVLFAAAALAEDLFVSLNERARALRWKCGGRDGIVDLDTVRKVKRVTADVQGRSRLQFLHLDGDTSVIDADASDDEIGKLFRSIEPLVREHEEPDGLRLRVDDPSTHDERDEDDLTKRRQRG